VLGTSQQEKSAFDSVAEVEISAVPDSPDGDGVVSLESPHRPQPASKKPQLATRRQALAACINHFLIA
jgi:hypothetical protein